ncbi:sigma-54 interaction domain-containing protein [Aneurinibacillus migulanus]|uniref:HTH-type transcriptional regulatory protein TyrR n=1 Tax=Aneurinibacillus migulanus TaxID=47500 RepID=A0A0M0H2K5_ANEMI|nr:sigma 54-interacting transcriptional regulator [Aneurinibacillus migulanus]KON96308.1 histidine kinase [Aneurinibacillus migulanus]MED0892225.1 sigma 54-interacting transcriptional regulator [Aneurinibacillus migulanus]MED1615823.1 sigma 54-interacting transcriptional regulator [Aneurinibacillus migulanus]SDI25297.1 PAS domain S-box-containing protein [Aneurinibacillus migulanus]GED12331.1 diguanylate cyclase [Aneurinibacillus migulanus]
MSNSMDDRKKIEMSAEMLKKILDYSPNEIYVLNKDACIVYANKAYEKHYGIKRDEIIGMKNDEILAKGYWKPSIIPYVLKEKKTVTIKQVSYVGKELLTTAIPLLNEEQDIELIITATQEPNYKELYITDEPEAEEINEIDFYKENLFTNNKRMSSVIKLCEKVAKVDTTVLIQGESGTGKGVIARHIHKKSRRKSSPFLTINCVTIPEDLLESELFGYVEGAFTGATRSGKEGLLERADGGTVFLDEIGEISPKIQAKLLQVVQDLEFIPVGGREVKKVDIRIISATNRNLYEMVQQKQFREDLYYRLHVVNLQIPPLRERREDIIPLTYYFLSAYNKKYKTNHIIEQDVLDIFYGYSWPGNIRQLENLVESLIVTSDASIQVSDLPAMLLQTTSENNSHNTGEQELSASTLRTALEDVEKKLIIQSYKRFRNTRKVAEQLSISQSKASRLVRKYCKDLDFYN